MDLPCGSLSHELSFLHSANLRSVCLKKGGICVSQSWPPRRELSKQGYRGRPFLHEGPWWIFPREWKVAFVRRRGGKKSCSFPAAHSPWLHQCWLFHHFVCLELKARQGGDGWTVRPSLREWPGKARKSLMAALHAWWQRGKGRRRQSWDPETKLPCLGQDVPRFQMPASQALTFLAYIISLRRKQHGNEICPII